MNAMTVIPRQQAPEFSLSDIHKIASTIAAGKLFGSTDVDAVMTLCLLAHAEGLHPVAVMRDYHMIQGKPSKKSEAMQRDFLASGGSIEWHQLDDTVAAATFSHPAGGSVRIDWTLDRAQKAGLLGNAMWKKYPRQMLKSRLISEGARTVFPGATSGMYVPEEVVDFDRGDEAWTGPRKARQAALEASEPTPLPPRHKLVYTVAPPPEGGWPCRTKGELKTALLAMYQELAGETEPAGHVDTVLRHREHLRQVQAVLPNYWHGDDGAGGFKHLLAEFSVTVNDTGEMLTDDEPQSIIEAG